MKNVLLAAACVIGFTSLAHAGEPIKAGTVDLSIGGAYAHFVGGDGSAAGMTLTSDDLHSGGFYGRVGYFVIDDLEIALAGGMVWGDTDISSAAGSINADVQVSKLGGELLYHLSNVNLIENITPYIGVGGGVAFFDVDISGFDIDDDFAEFHGIIGARMAIRDNLSLIMEYQPGAVFYDDGFAPDDTKFQQQVFVGLTIHLN